MSIRGQVNKISGDVRRAINHIAKNGMVDSSNVVRGTQKIIGYVCDIHEDGDFAGTIDVQEYNYEPGDYDFEGAGLHENVLLSAIQDNSSGYLIVPMLFSDVMITQNPVDGQEYVIMYSHAKSMQLNAHEDIEIGVTEVEEFVESDDGLEKDYDELEPTKNRTSTHYNATSIVDQVVSPDDENGLKQEKKATGKVITVGDTKITINGSNVLIETSGKMECKIGGSTITESDGKIDVKCSEANVKADTTSIDGGNITIKGNTTIQGGTLTTRGTANTDLSGPYNAIKVCPFSGAPHCGSQVQC